MNHLMILNYYQDLTDSLDLKEVGNDFIGANESRSKTKEVSHVLKEVGNDFIGANESRSKTVAKFA